MQKLGMPKPPKLSVTRTEMLIGQNRYFILFLPSLSRRVSARRRSGGTFSDSPAAMFRFALRRAASAAVPLPCRSSLRLSICRPFSAAGAGDATVARQMIDYAIHHARSRKSGPHPTLLSAHSRTRVLFLFLVCCAEESYAQALLVLEQGLGNLQRGDAPDYDVVGMVLLAMSTVLSERFALDARLKSLDFF